MNRAERHAQVKRLKQTGLTFEEIADELGLARSTITSAYYDPTGEKDRARKAKRFGHCIDCGARIFNSGSEPGKRCNGCQKAHSRTVEARRINSVRNAGRFRWTDGQICDALRLHSTHGRLKKITYDAAYDAAPRGTLPSPPTILNRFGSWNAALRAAGLLTVAPMASGWGVGREGALLAVLDCAYDLGHLPTYSEYEKWQAPRGRPSGATVRNRWGGSFMRVIDAAEAEFERERTAAA